MAQFHKNLDELLNQERALSTAEKEVLLEDDFSTTIINNSLDGILAYDRSCRYTVWNPAMERISGMKKEAVLGRCAFDVFPFLRDIGEDRIFERALQGENVITQERVFTIPETGKYGYFEGHYSPLRDETGAIVGGLCVIRDVSQQKLVSDELSRLREKLQSKIDEMETRLGKLDQKV